MPNVSDHQPHVQKDEADMMVSAKMVLLYYALALLVLMVDQASKYHFNSRLEPYESVSIIPSVLDFTLAYNKGAAFSMLASAGGWQKWFFAILGLVVSVFIVAYLRQVYANARTLSVGLALVLGGAIGNVIDRIVHGHVIDFIHVHYHDVWHYPIFNVADMGICVGMALVIIDVLFLEKGRNTAGL